MKEIQLTQGQVTFVDDEDFDQVSQYKWCAALIPNYANGGRFMATRTVTVCGIKRNVLLHRFIMDAQKGHIVDHIDGNTLNNQRSNLRLATRSENGANNRKVLQKHNTSGFRGVYFSKQGGKWLAAISVCGKKRNLGMYADVYDAARAYNEAAIKYHGEFATLNPIEGEAS